MIAPKSKRFSPFYVGQKVLFGILVLTALLFFNGVPSHSYEVTYQPPRTEWVHSEKLVEATSDVFTISQIFPCNYSCKAIEYAYYQRWHSRDVEVVLKTQNVQYSILKPTLALVNLHAHHAHSTVEFRRSDTLLA